MFQPIFNRSTSMYTVDEDFVSCVAFLKNINFKICSTVMFRSCGLIALKKWIKWSFDLDIANFRRDAELCRFCYKRWILENSLFSTFYPQHIIWFLWGAMPYEALWTKFWLYFALPIFFIFWKLWVQLKKYETAPNFIQLSLNLTSDCLLISKQNNFMINLWKNW